VTLNYDRDVYNELLKLYVSDAILLQIPFISTHLSRVTGGQAEAKKPL